MPSSTLLLSVPIVSIAICYQTHGQIGAAWILGTAAVQVLLLFWLQGGFRRHAQLTPEHTAHGKLGSQSFKAQILQQGTDTPCCAYRSRTHRVKVCMKIRTPAQPDDMPSDMQLRIQQAFKAVGRSQSAPSAFLQMQVVDMAMRSGCVMISLELTTAQIDSSTSSSCSSGLGNDEQQKILQAVLHGLKPALQQFQQKQLAENSNLPQQSAFKPQPLQPTEDITIQVGQHSWNVKWDTREGRWLASQMPQQDGVPTATMGLVQLLEPNNDITSTARTQLPNSHVHTEELEACCGSVSARFLLHVWDFSALNGPIKGWRAPQAGHHVPNQDKSLQLLAHMDGTYLDTIVSEVPVNASANVPARATLLQVHASLPRGVDRQATNLRHITFELWWGERCLHTVHSLLLPNTARPASRRSSRSGYSMSNVEAASMELKTMEQQLWALGAAVRHSEVVGWQDLNTDIATWMAGVQQITQHGPACNGLCTSSTAPASGSRSSNKPGVSRAHTPGQPVLQPEVLLQLGNDLLTYCGEDVTMPALYRLLEHQLHNVVLPWASGQLRTNSPKRSLLSAILSGRRLLFISSFGYNCSACEQQYQSRLNAYLANFQAVASALQVLFAAFALKAVPGPSYSATYILLAIWGLLHMAVCASHIQPKQRWTPSCSVYGLWAWGVRSTGNLLIGLKLITPLARIYSFPTPPVMAAVLHLVMALGEQLPAGALLPAWATSCAVMLDIPGLFLTARLYGSRGYSWWWSLAGVLLVVGVIPRLLAMQLRSMLAAQ